MVNALVHSVKEKTIRSITLLVAREFIMKICAVVGQFILVHILMPEVFGIFALLSFIVGAAEMFTDLGLSLLIIQKKHKPTKQEIASIFTVKFILSCVAFTFIFLLAPYFHYIYRSFTPTDITMLRIFSLTLLAKPMRTISLSLLERGLRYKEIARIDISGIVIYYSVAIFFALQNQGIKSFIIAVVIKEVVELIFAFYFYRFVPKISFHFRLLKNMLHQGVYLQLGTILGFIDRSTIPVIAGLKTPSYDVGFLDWSMNVASIPLLLANNVGRVSFSSFAKIQDDKQLIAKAIEKSFSLLNVFTIGAIVATLVFGRSTIHYLVSDKWLSAFPSLCWYMAGTFFLNGTGVLGHAIMALGETKKLFVASFFVIAFEWIVSVLLLVSYGFTGVALGSFIGSAVMFFTFVVLCRSIIIPVDLRSMLKMNLLIFFLSLLSAIAVSNLLPQTVMFFIVKLSFFLMLYVGIYLQFSRSNFIEALSLIKKQL